MLHPLRGERALAQRLLHGAARLAFVGAIAEATTLSELVDFGEAAAGGRAFALGEQRELTHARRVDQDPAARQNHELPLARGMAAASVVLAHRARTQPVLAEQLIGEARLADARRAEQNRGRTAADAFVELP